MEQMRGSSKVIAEIARLLLTQRTLQVVRSSL